MADLRGRKHQSVQQFIEFYTLLPCLWRIKSKDFFNKQLKIGSATGCYKILQKVNSRVNKSAVLKIVYNLQNFIQKK